MKKLISCILALLLLTTAAFAVPGDSCVVLGEELTLGETDGIFTALGVERGTAMELALSRPDAETYFSDVPEKAASVGVFVRIRSGGEGLSLSLSNITGAETAIAAALTAAGVTDAEIVAAAPEETGALAILPAVFKAYETLTCQPLDPEAKETAAAALREADALSGELDTSKLEELLGAMTDFFDELAALSDDELRERIRSIAAEHGMTLNDAQTQQLADLFRKICPKRWRRSARAARAPCPPPERSGTASAAFSSAWAKHSPRSSANKLLQRGNILCLITSLPHPPPPTCRAPGWRSTTSRSSRIPIP